MYKRFNYEYIPKRNIYIVKLEENPDVNYTFSESICQKAKINLIIYRPILEKYNAIFPDTLIDPIFKVPYFENEKDIESCVEILNSILLSNVLKGEYDV